MPWREANLWLHENAATRDVTLLTVQTTGTGLHAYAKWLEENSVDWRHFPARKADRCLVRYKGSLIEARDKGILAPSTASQRMRVTVRFYRWLGVTGLISPAWPMWREQTLGIRLTDPLGFDRTVRVTTTDLRISNRKSHGLRLEDGLLPVTVATRDNILGFCRERASEELFLMLALGFYSGLRISSIANLKVQSLTNAVPDPATPELYKIAVGPGADPPVATKYSVTGQAWIPRELLDQLLKYSHSIRRLQREEKARPENKDLVFLTRFGNPYAQRATDKSVAINVEIHALKKLAVKYDADVPKDFHFHQSRCTFATELARLAIRFGGPINAISIVKDALLHKNESISINYIKFIEQSPAKEAAANAFTVAFLGVLSQK